jgi:N4-(beta-N-acetylglucosaminyl)-L-asparaginase
MRQGRSPQQACEEAVRRIVKRRPEASKSLQVGFLSLNKNGDVGAFAIQKGFSYARCDNSKTDLITQAKSMFA